MSAGNTLAEAQRRAMVSGGKSSSFHIRVLYKQHRWNVICESEVNRFELSEVAHAHAARPRAMDKQVSELSLWISLSVSWSTSPSDSLVSSKNFGYRVTRIAAVK